MKFQHATTKKVFDLVAFRLLTERKNVQNIKKVRKISPQVSYPQITNLRKVSTKIVVVLQIFQM